MEEQTIQKGSNPLKVVMEELQQLSLPSPSWASHICHGKLVLLSITLSDDNMVDICKCIIMSEKDGRLSIDTRISNIKVTVPYLNYNLENTSDVNEFTNYFDKVQFCKEYLKGNSEGCEIVGRDFSDLCEKCEKAVAEKSQSSKDSRDVLKCELCSEICSTLEAMKYHAEIHHDNNLQFHESKSAQETAEPLKSILKMEKRNMCAICGCNQRSSEALRKHELLHFDDGFKCAVCKETFNCLRRIVEHSKRYHPKVAFMKCQFCDKYFVAARYLRVHLRSHVSTQPLDCSWCSLKFHSHLQLKEHEKQHAPHICTKCKKTFRDKTELFSHKTKEHKKQPFFPCPICHKIITQKIYLIIHLQSHDVKVFPCNRCRLQFKTFNELLTHKSVFHPSKKHRCQKCRKRLKSANEEHVCDRKIFKCEVCQKEFGKYGSLKMHMRSHTMMKLFSCGVCQKSFSTKGNLAVHERAHTEEQRQDDVI